MKLIASNFLLCAAIALLTFNTNAQNFSGKATYISKSKMDLGTYGANFSEARKKQIAARLKNRLEKTYFLTF